jgi:hypothetical protein
MKEAHCGRVSITPANCVFETIIPPPDIGAAPLPKKLCGSRGTKWQTSITRPAYAPGELANAELTIELEDTSANVTPGLYKPTAFLIQGNQSEPLEVQEVTGPNDLQAKQLRFKAIGKVGGEDGVGVVVFHIDDTFQPSQAFYVSRALN